MCLLTRPRPRRELEIAKLTRTVVGCTATAIQEERVRVLVGQGGHALMATKLPVPTRVAHGHATALVAQHAPVPQEGSHDGREALDSWREHGTCHGDVHGMAHVMRVARAAGKRLRYSLLLCVVVVVVVVVIVVVVQPNP
jgi:hypothetical protein